MNHHLVLWFTRMLVREIKVWKFKTFSPVFPEHFIFFIMCLIWKLFLLVWKPRLINNDRDNWNQVDSGIKSRANERYFLSSKPKTKMKIKRLPGGVRYVTSLPRSLDKHPSIPHFSHVPRLTKRSNLKLRLSFDSLWEAIFCIARFQASSLLIKSDGRRADRPAASTLCILKP